MAIYKSKGRCEKMNFNEEEQKLLSEANVLVETNKTYTDDEVKGFSNKIEIQVPWKESVTTISLCLK